MLINAIDNFLFISDLLYKRLQRYNKILKYKRKRVINNVYPQNAPVSR